jgi:hypothetical protein
MILRALLLALLALPAAAETYVALAEGAAR